MVPQDLPPEVSQYLDPAFTPLVAILWHVIGVPICQLLLLVFVAPDLSHAADGMREAMGGFVVALMTGVLMILLAIVGLVILAFLVFFLFATFATLAFWREKD
jgi:hypothetical protein